MPILESTGLVAGSDFFLAFSPECIDPGDKDYMLRNTPKVIGGYTAQCTHVAVALYGTIVNQVVEVSSTMVAELVKLLENTYRAVNIGLANELAQMANVLGIDVWEVIRAAATKPFGFVPFYPGPGLGGHCIPIDPHYLAWKLRSLNYRARFIELASEVNGEMPQFVVEQITEALNEQAKCVKGAYILVLGVAYKRNVGDVPTMPVLITAGYCNMRNSSWIHATSLACYPAVNMRGAWAGLGVWLSLERTLQRPMLHRSIVLPRRDGD